MSEIIKTKNHSDGLTLKITGNSAAFWEFDYEDRGKHYSGKSDDEPSLTHEIKLPPDFVHFRVTWAFRFVNTTGSVTGHRIKMEWFQKGNSLHVWKKEGSVPSEDDYKIVDDGYIL